MYITYHCANSWVLLQFGSILIDDAMLEVRELWDLGSTSLIVNLVANKGRAPALAMIMESMGVSVGVPFSHHHLTPSGSSGRTVRGLSRRMRASCQHYVSKQRLQRYQISQASESRPISNQPFATTRSKSKTTFTAYSGVLEVGECALATM